MKWIGEHIRDFIYRFRSAVYLDGIEAGTPASGGTPSVDTINSAVADKAMYSDAYLMILSNKNNPIVEIDFKNVFPTSIGGLSFDGGATDVEYLTCDVTFKYQIYEIRTL